MDSYKTISHLSQGEYKEKGSKFFAYAFPISDKKAFDESLEFVKKEHFKARHHCFAYRLGLEDDNYRMSDDGEPSGTAGKPIYGQLLSHELRNILVVVVRYFGGIKLGTSGLIRSYKEATIDAIKNGEIITVEVRRKVSLQFGYEQMGEIMNAIKQCNFEIVSKKFEADAQVVLGIKNSLFDEQFIRLKAKILDKSLEEAKEIKKIEGIIFTLES